jgi:bacterioferritin
VPDNPSAKNIQDIRERARRDVEQGAITPNYGADKKSVLRLLNEALATEIVCTLRYKRHYFMAKGLTSAAIAQEFLEHANEETSHADRIADRIVQLGGAPDFSPEGLAERSHAEYVEGDTLTEMIREDLVAERVAIESYRQMIGSLGGGDPTTRRLLEDILAVEEEHAEDLLSLIEGRAQG